MRGRITYFRPKDLGQALEFLWLRGEETTVLSGGTDVMIDLRSGAVSPGTLLDVSRLPELKGAEVRGDLLWVGAGTTLTEIHGSETIGRFAPVLQKSARKFGSRQIRNVATIGGNVAHCSPCADTVPPLLIHEAEALVADRKGKRRVSIETVAAAPYKSALGPAELIIGFELKRDASGFSDFQKIGRRKELSIARASLAVSGRVTDGHRLRELKIALGSCTPVPQRVAEVEGYLSGKVLTPRLLWKAGGLLAEAMVRVSGRRASTVYKEKAVRGLLVRALSPYAESNGSRL